MDATERFVAESNIARFIDRLTCDGISADLWTKLLVAEMERFSTKTDKLEVAAKCLDICQTRALAQNRRMFGLSPGHPDLVSCQQILEILKGIQEVVMKYRVSLEMDRNHLPGRD